MSVYKVLIIENHVATAQLLRNYIEDFGYYVCGVAANMNETLRLLETRDPDLILLDADLDGKCSGILVATTIKRLYEIPIVFMASYNDISAIEKVVSDGSNTYVRKPVKADELKTHISIVLRKSSLKRLAEKSKSVLLGPFSDCNSRVEYQ